MNKLVTLIGALSLAAFASACYGDLNAQIEKAEHSASAAAGSASSAEAAAQQAQAASQKADQNAASAEDSARRATNAADRVEAAFRTSVTK
jgi:hypothetical protein